MVVHDHARAWTENETEELIELRRDCKLRWVDIGARLNRSASSARNKLLRRAVNTNRGTSPRYRCGRCFAFKRNHDCPLVPTYSRVRIKMRVADDEGRAASADPLDTSLTPKPISRPSHTLRPPLEEPSIASMPPMPSLSSPNASESIALHSYARSYRWLDEDTFPSCGPFAWQTWDNDDDVTLQRAYLLDQLVRCI